MEIVYYTDISTGISTGISPVCSSTAVGHIWRPNKTSYYVPVLLARIALWKLISEKFQ